MDILKQYLLSITPSPCPPSPNYMFNHPLPEKFTLLPPPYTHPNPIPTPPHKHPTDTQPTPSAKPIAHFVGQTDQPTDLGIEAPSRSLKKKL